MVLGSVGILHHELWRDETQAWLLARDSPSVVALFRNTRNEGHPLLWHYCLFIISRISYSPIAMQIFHLLLAIGSIWLIVKKSPFSLLERSLITFGYFTFYEYALLSRSYGLGVFLTFLFCALYCGFNGSDFNGGRKRQVNKSSQAWLMVLTLALLANTTVLGLILSGVLAIALYYRLFFTQPKKPRPAIWPMTCALITAWSVSAIQIGRSLLNPMGLKGFDADAREAISVYATEPNITEPNITGSDVLTQTTDITPLASWLDNADKLLQIILKSHLPLPSFRFHFWNQHLLENQGTYTVADWLMMMMSLALVGLVMLIAFLLLRKTPIFLFIYALGGLGMCSIFVIAYRGTTRHYGNLFILLLACLWLARWSSQHVLRRSTGQPTSYASTNKLANRLFTAILCVQVIAGIHAYSADLRHPFSASNQTAQIIKAQFNTLPVLAINQRPISPVSSYLNRPLFYPEANQFGSFWSRSYPEMKDEATITEALQAFSSTHPDFIAILTRPLSLPPRTKPATPTLEIHYIDYVGPSIVEDEAFFLYRIHAVNTK